MILKCVKSKSSLFTVGKEYHVHKIHVDYDRVKDGEQYQITTDKGSTIYVKLSGGDSEFRVV